MSIIESKSNNHHEIKDVRESSQSESCRLVKEFVRASTDLRLLLFSGSEKSVAGRESRQRSSR